MDFIGEAAYIGIDPGASGAAAIISESSTEYFDFENPNQIVDEFEKWSENYAIRLCVLEHVHAMPGNGVKSMFSFGQNFGTWLGILASFKIPFRLITPQKWQKQMLTCVPGTTKERSLTAARQLYPKAELHLKKHHGRADALLIATYAKGIS